MIGSMGRTGARFARVGARMAALGGLLLAPVASAQIRTVDPNTAIDSDLAPPPVQNSTPTDPGVDTSLPPPASSTDSGAYNAAPAAGGATATGAPVTSNSPPAAMAPGARCAAPFMLLGMGGKQPDVPRTVGEAKAAFQEAYGKPVTTLAQSFVSEMLTAVTLATAVPSYKYSRVFAVGFEALCDSFLSSIPNEAQRNELRDCMCTALELDGKKVEFYLVGRKGRPVINRTYPGRIVANYDTTGVKEPGFDQAQAIAHELTEMYLNGKFDVAHLFYSRFKSALAQVPTEQQIIPVKIPADADRNAIAATVEYEPSEEAILDDLLPRNVTVQIFKALLENNASEQGASMTAMDNATRNAGDLINKLTIQYNRSRQAAITTELVEIISGAEAL